MTWDSVTVGSGACPMAGSVGTAAGGVAAAAAAAAAIGVGAASLPRALSSIWGGSIQALHMRRAWPGMTVRVVALCKPEMLLDEHQGRAGQVHRVVLYNDTVPCAVSCQTHTHDAARGTLVLARALAAATAARCHSLTRASSSCAAGSVAALPPHPCPEASQPLL